MLITCLAAPAFAQSEEGIEPAEGKPAAGMVEALEAQLEAGLAELAVVPVDCAAACEALASLRRAATRICELDPGAPCEAARRKLEEAERRVREACPDCSLERQKESIHPKKGGLSERPEGEADDDAAPEAAPGLASAPPSEQRGGCASCAVGHARGPGGVFGLGLGMGLLVSLWIRRRRL